MSEDKNIYAAFVKAQAAFAPALKKSLNPHFKTKYASLAACVEAVIDALNSNGIALVQKTHPDERGVTVETVFIHSSGESMSGGFLHLPAGKSDPQAFCSALTYARRNSLMAACGIAPEDDDANLATAKVQVEKGFDVQASIRLLEGADSVEKLNSFWKFEVAKYDAKSVEYKALKQVATERKAQLTAEVAA